MIEQSQYEKALIFKELHKRPVIFIVPNPWDAGSAKILTQQEYYALATTSAGLAYSLGKVDGMRKVTRKDALENSQAIVAATHLPVITDLENGHGDSPETCAETIALAATIGLIGGSIEDATGRGSQPIYEFDPSVARIRAAVSAARKLPFHFTLTARAENHLHGIYDIDDTIRRLVAYAEAGADVLFAPGVKSKDDIGKIVRAVSPLPVNVLWGYPDIDLTINDLSNLGVKRVSLGSSLARMAYGNLINAGNEVKRKGTAHYAEQAISYSEMIAETEDVIRRLARHLEKLTEVLKVYYHANEDVIWQELAMYKMETDVVADKLSVERLLRLHGARVVVIRRDYTVFETSDHREETDKLISVLQPYGLIEFVRSARVAIIKDSEGFNRKLREFGKAAPNVEAVPNDFLSELTREINGSVL